jgi:transcription initiation factor TFIIIB Brf1 subunit/transcription initiation factor TFIIB
MTRRFVEAMAGAGVPQREIAAVLAVTVPTLRKHYRDELRRGSALVQAKLVGNLLRIASGSDGTALKAIIFSLQCRFGWSRYLPPPRG